MAVSRHAIDTVFAQLKATGENTYADLAKSTGYSLPTIKNAIGVLKLQGSISVSFTKPVSFKAIENPPLAGQTLIIREPLPPQELDSKMMEIIERDLANPDAKMNDEMLVAIFERIRTANPEKLHNLLVFLVNVSEVIRNRVAKDELDISDFDTNSLKGKK